MILRSITDLFKRRKNQRKGSLPNWKKIFADCNEDLNLLKVNKNGTKILIPTCVGGQAAVTILESLIAVALSLRGIEVSFLLCDECLPACLNMHINKIKNKDINLKEKLNPGICKGCYLKGNAVLSSTGLSVLYFSDFLSIKDKSEIEKVAYSINFDEIKKYQKDNLKIGEHANAGALRFFARGQLNEEPYAEGVLRKYFEASLITHKVIENVFKTGQFKAAVFNHGIYVPHGIIGEVARSNGIGVVNWQVAYKKKCFIFSHHETYHHALIREDSNKWENIKWNKKIEAITIDYLKSRWYGTQDWIWFHDQPTHNLKEIKKEIKIEFDRPVITALTNVFWDAQLHYKANAFDNMLEWLYDTIDYFKSRPDLILVIRVHPAEVRGAIPSRQPIVEEIKRKFGELPENLIIVNPESQISTYTLCENSDAVIIYGTKTGVESAAMGIPVIVAGEAWIRGKNLTYDAESREDYRAILDKLPFKYRLNPQKLMRARKYAFHFFFRRFIPIDILRPCNEGVPYEVNISSIKQLKGGGDKGLDVICDGIVTGSEFIFKAEEILK